MTDIRLSKSKILDYLNCPRMFYFKNCTTFGKTKKQTSEALENGSMLHEIYEAFNTNREKFEQYYEFVKGKKEFEDNLFGFFTLLDFFKVGTTKHSEVKVYNEEWNLLGYIDAIYYMPKGTETMVYNPRFKKNAVEPEYISTILEKDEYWLIDYKTGKFHPNRNSEMMLELYIYEKLANQYLSNGWGGQIDRVGFFYTKFPEVKFVKPVNKTDRNRAMKKFDTVVDKIKNDEFSEVSNRLCSWCPFMSICDDYKDAVVGELNDHVLMAV